MSTDRPVTDMPPHVLEYLREHNILTLATASPTGLPHAVTMVYVSDGLAIYFCTRPDTRTARHIEQNPAVSFTIDEYNPDWSKTKGIQGSGEGRVLLNADEIRHVVELFHKKFSFLSDQRTPNVSCFRITPSELHFIDNESTGGGQVGQAMGIDF